MSTHVAERSSSQAMSRNRQAILPRIAPNLVLAVVMVWILFPIFWLLSSAFRPASQIQTLTPEWLPRPFSLENFQWLLGQQDFWLTYRNSFIVATATSVLSVTITSLAAYSLARYPYRGKGVFVRLLVVTHMLPGTLLILSIFLLFSQLHLTNTYAGLVIAYSTFAIPYSALLLRGYFAQSPRELEEAALVDGCSRLGAFLRVTLPITLPGIIAVSLLAFILAWNNFLFPVILAKDSSTQTAIVELTYMVSGTQYGGSTNWGGIMAAASLITIPVVVIFAALQRFLVQGLTAGALKG